MPEQLAITFHGGAGSVTGANFLLSRADGTGPKFLIDCGAMQGSRAMEEKNRESFAYDPASITALFVSHAHLDHIGRIPKLVHDGFRGKIYSTAPTKEISELSLVDSLGIWEKDKRHHAPAAPPPLYDEKDVIETMALWEVLEYHKPLRIDGFVITAKDSGHILGSAMYEFEFGEGSASRRIVFTGDLGNSPAPLLRDTEVIANADYLVMESVYGDRNHEHRDERREILEDVIENTMRAGGTLVIPSFSIERTQEMLYEMEQMMEGSRIPLVPVYLDSPLAIKVTEVYKKYAPSFLNSAVAPAIAGRDGIFDFPQLHETLSTDESKAIFADGQKKIILAGSGMSTGGRILHHERHYLGDSKNTLLLVGYQAAGSLGRQLQEGAKTVNIFGETIAVRAKVVSISGYSAHKDADHLLQFVSDTADRVRRVFVTLGEPKASFALAQKIRDYLAVDAVVPEPGEQAILQV